MLAQRLRRWPNIKTLMFQRVVFAGYDLQCVITRGDVISISPITAYLSPELPCKPDIVFSMEAAGVCPIFSF